MTTTTITITSLPPPPPPAPSSFPPCPSPISLEDCIDRDEKKKSRPFAEECHLFINGSTPGDVKQGSLGDCWFLGEWSVVM